MEEIERAKSYEIETETHYKEALEKALSLDTPRYFLGFRTYSPKERQAIAVLDEWKENKLRFLKKRPESALYSPLGCFCCDKTYLNQELDRIFPESGRNIQHKTKKRFNSLGLVALLGLSLGTYYYNARDVLHKRTSLDSSEIVNLPNGYKTTKKAYDKLKKAYGFINGSIKLKDPNGRCNISNLDISNIPSDVPYKFIEETDDDGDKIITEEEVIEMSIGGLENFCEEYNNKVKI